MTTFTPAVPDTLFGALMADILTDAALMAQLTDLERRRADTWAHAPSPQDLRRATDEEFGATLRREDHLLRLALDELDAAYLEALRPVFAARGVRRVTLDMPLVRALTQALWDHTA
ncbi:hypothetical protein [Deinococcus soli (ex Cha et al. 2016)]|uniref:Uncharacterized protein n=2 Tax=Deinococcus soli (ex Cha et al. 2016) TaxID=1309411 RepID=A0ACC6KFC3_9DEIO|nr:hypothetical protein [Deinococcus soli (ex Cha et al. 2016)]MDR6218254.1 hypothetical protein [Deinococcus soli (ex Cha et al. 2016)]MDR6328994.1 hypothetical protein [Deinococcus soli (ex Cha et al. 2016)]MDR6751267.1 hypothetical protein [Deinococcus soli (ex Cha et al. 2016)]